MLVENWFICLFLALPVVGLALFARADQKSWFAPGAFFCLVWSLYLCLPLLLAPDIKIWPGAVLAIFFATMAVYTGSVVGLGGFHVRLACQMRNGEVSSNSGHKRNKQSVLPALVWLTLLGSFLGCLGVIV